MSLGWFLKVIAFINNNSLILVKICEQTKPTRTWTVILLGIGIVFFVVGLFFLHGEQFVIYRLFSALIPFVFLIFLLGFLRKKASKGLIVFFILYAVSRFITIFYEMDYMASLFLILNAFAFLSLVWYVAKSISFAKMNLFFKLIFVVVAIINGYFVYQLIVIINDGTLSDAHYISLLFNGVCSIVMAFSTLLYNHQLGSRASMFFFSGCSFNYLFSGLPYIGIL
ncbi:MAG: hypothetical protein ACI828_001253 [Flavobacteriales bacterium]|jgi:hypothetical protein